MGLGQSDPFRPPGGMGTIPCMPSQKSIFDDLDLDSPPAPGTLEIDRL